MLHTVPYLHYLKYLTLVKEFDINFYQKIHIKIARKKNTAVRDRPGKRFASFMETARASGKICTNMTWFMNKNMWS